MMKKTSIQVFALLVFMLCINNAKAQVTIAPTNLFVESTSKFGTYMVINGSNQAQEISIDFFFGYSTTDDQGNRSLVSNDSVLAKKHSITEYIRAFPQNFTLTPGQRQIVRLRINAPNDLPDGTYWSRIRTTSTPETPPIELSTSETVTARVGINVEQITGLYYKKGEVSTGITINNMSTQQADNGTLFVLSDISRTGNSPFLGGVTTSLINQDGKTVRESYLATTIYFDGVFKQALDLNDLPSGRYKIQVKFESQRNDISSNDLIKMPTATKSINYTIR